jgi:NTP pyrophosphatase (non-canonical NTP hydrolase)
MTPAEYIKLTASTDHGSQGTKDMAGRMYDCASLIHYVLGVGTEAAELQDAVKKTTAYGKELDITNIKEETGDLLWYLARICSLFGWTFEEVMELNINKLKARYGDKFTQQAALSRDLNKERTVLEK